MIKRLFNVNLVKKYAHHAGQLNVGKINQTKCNDLSGQNKSRYKEN